jgi:hypothetical protein
VFIFENMAGPVFIVPTTDACSVLREATPIIRPQLSSREATPLIRPQLSSREATPLIRPQLSSREATPLIRPLSHSRKDGFIRGGLLYLKEHLRTILVMFGSMIYLKY